jgi:murein DD-endopeptidase MepM/ murein hydrolase activator NlpD
MNNFLAMAIILFLSCECFAQADSTEILLNIPGYPQMFELNVGESHHVSFVKDGKTLSRTIKLISITPFFEPNYWFSDSPKTYSKAEIKIEVSGEPFTLIHRPYEMPAKCNGLRLYVETIKEWAEAAEIADLKNVRKQVRLSVTSADDSWGPGNMTFPIVDYRWKAAVYQNTWSALVPYNLRYYHRGEDYGAIPDRLTVAAPFDGKVTRTPLPNGDGASNRVGIVNKDGVVFEIAHMNTETILPVAAIGKSIKRGTPVGKTGMTWGGKKSQHSDPHVHFDLHYSKITLGSYPYLVEAYLNTYPDTVIAVAGNYLYSVPGRPVTLDATRSITRPGEKIEKYTWTLHDGEQSDSSVVQRLYDKPGLYTEELQVVTASGASDRDFVQVRVYDTAHARDVSYGWAYYYPVRNIHPNTDVLFWNRLYNTAAPVIINFGDGTPLQEIGDELTHRYASPGRYVVTLSSSGKMKEPVTVKMEVVVE